MSDRLLDAAETRMRQGGYNSVSFRDLAADMQIKSASVHYHFPRKEDLGIALISRYTTAFLAALDEEAQDAKTPKGKLRAFNRVYRRALTDYHAVCLCGLLGAEGGGLPDPVNSGVQSFFKANIDWVAANLPSSLSRKEKAKRASAVVSAHQGAVIIAHSMQDVAVFDNATSFLLDHVVAEK